METTTNTVLSELAPWIAIIVTLIVSILIPTITQIITARLQAKREDKLREFELKKATLDKFSNAYESFLVDVGAALVHGLHEELANAGASTSRLCLYAPKDMLNDLYTLHDYLHNKDFDEAEPIFLEIAGKLHDLVNGGNQ